MNVLYLTNNAGRASTTVATAGWVETLQPRGLCPVVVSPIFGEFSDWLSARRVPCYQQTLPLPVKWWPMAFMRALWRLRNIVKKHRIDLIHCNEHEVYPIGQYLGRLCGIRVVVTVHFTLERKYCEWAFAGRRQPARMFFVSRRNLDECAPALAGIVPADRLAVVHNGLKLADYEPNASMREEFRRAHAGGARLLIGVACALRPRKQLEHFFAAFERMKTFGVRLLVGGFAVAGDEQYAEKLIANAKSRLGDRFVSLGPLNDLRPLCNGLDLFVNTSQEESFGIACLEAMACGCPVVGYDSKAVDEVVLPDGGEITPQDDVEVLARRLDDWLSDANRLAAGRALARRQAERFDLRQLSEELWHEYERVLGHVECNPLPNGIHGDGKRQARADSLTSSVTATHRYSNPQRGDRSVTGLYLSNAPILGGTARILQSWLLLGRDSGWQAKLAVQKESDLTEWSRREGFPTLVDPLCWPKWQMPVRAMWHAWRVARWARQVDLIHVNEHDVYPFLFALKKCVRVPVVCHVRYKLERNMAEWMFRGSRCPDALLWTSQQQKDDCAEAIEGIVPEQRQHVVRLGFELETYGTLGHRRDAKRQKLGILPDEIVVGTASPLRPRKRVHEFIELVVRLARKYPKIVGLIAGDEIAGDESYRQQIERQIESAGLGRRLRWLGFLEPVEPFYHACDIQVSTSEYETFGNSVCEAMACARPVAAYRGGSVAEVVGDAGMIVESGDLNGLTAAVERLVLDEALRTRLGQAARQRVAEHFNPRNSFEQLKGIYESLLAGRNTKWEAVTAS